VHELRGRDVVSYGVAWSGLWVSYGEWVSNYLDKDWFSGDRVLVREIVGKPPRLIIAARFAEFAVHNPSIICIKPRDAKGHGVLGFLELYLNSRLASEYIAQISSKTAKGMFPKVLVKDLRELPFPPVRSLDEGTLERAAQLRGPAGTEPSPEAVDDFIEHVFSRIDRR
jgi:hypothetical protein